MEPRPQEGVRKSVGRRKRLPHQSANPSASMWDRRFRLSIRRFLRFPHTFRGSGVVEVRTKPVSASFARLCRSVTYTTNTRLAPASANDLLRLDRTLPTARDAQLLCA